MAGMKLDCLMMLGLAAIVIQFTVSARADDVDHMTVFGHQLAIKDDPAGKALYVDGKNVMADFMIGINGTPLIVDGQPVVLASDANGGNGWEVSPFYISFPPTGEPVVTPLLDTCVLPTVVNKGDHLELTRAPNPAALGDKWTYAPTTGFVHVASIPYQRDQTQDWRNVSAHKLDSIFSVMANSEIAAQIDHLLGSDADDFRKYLTGPPPSKASITETTFLAWVARPTIVIAHRPSFTSMMGLKRRRLLGRTTVPRSPSGRRLRNGRTRPAPS